MKSSSERPSRFGWRKLRFAPLLLALGAFVAFGVSSGFASTNATTTPAATTTAKVSAPSNTTRPTISGKAQDGQTMAASPGKWTNSPTSYSYQWLRCDKQGANCDLIQGANSERYTLTSSDTGHTIRVQVTATNSAGSGKAESDPTATIQAVGSAPVNTAKPTISGSPSVGSSLAINKGTWTGLQPITLSYQWQRCDNNGNNCSNISGATGTTYNVTSTDVGNTIRVQETAKNSKGTSTVSSTNTPSVTPAKGGTIAVSLVMPPERLIVDKVSFTPTPLRTRRTLVARFHVSDTRGFSVEGALVYALGLPYGWVRNANEAPTNASGWATLVFRPTAALPIRRGTDLVVFVRARKPGDNLLAGVSTRRLVQAAIR